jgi:hypothetical protein
MLRTVILLFAAATAVLAQKTAFDRLKREAASLKAVPEEKITDDHVAMAAPLHLALRDWIESRLPEDKGLLSVTFGNLEIQHAGRIEGRVNEPGCFACRHG